MSNMRKRIQRLTPHDVAAGEGEDQGTAPDPVYRGVCQLLGLFLSPRDT